MNQLEKLPEPFETLQPGEWQKMVQIAVYQRQQAELFRKHHAAMQRQQQKYKAAAQQMMAAQRQLASLQHAAAQAQIIARHEKQEELSMQLQQLTIPLPCVSNDRCVTFNI